MPELERDHQQQLNILRRLDALERGQRTLHAILASALGASPSLAEASEPKPEPCNYTFQVDSVHTRIEDAAATAQGLIKQEPGFSVFIVQSPFGFLLTFDSDAEYWPHLRVNDVGLHDGLHPGRGGPAAGLATRRGYRWLRSSS